eukprot:s7248_g3.t1
MTRLVTKGGIGLHFLPGPLDKWISREADQGRTARGTAADQGKKPRETKPETRQPREKADDNKTTPHTATDAGEAAQRTPANAEGNDDEPEAVDWGSDESEHKAPTKDEMEEPHTASAEGAPQPACRPKAAMMTTSPTEGKAVAAWGRKDPEHPAGARGDGQHNSSHDWGRRGREHPAGAQHEGRGKCSPACVVKCNKYKNT